MVDRARSSGPLEGYIPIHPRGCNQVVGPFVSPPDGTIVAPRRREKTDPPGVDLSLAPAIAEVDQAWDVIEAALPGVNRGYHCALLVAMLVAQRAVGTPPMIAATGQSGSAKTAQVHLAAGALGTRADQITLGSTEDTVRKAGLALEAGTGCIFIDEIGRVDGVFAKIEPILSANSTLHYCAKYRNEQQAPMRASIVLLGSTLPEAIVRSPEMERRAVGFRLLGADKYWRLTAGDGSLVDLTDVRRLDFLRGALDVVTAHVWWRLHGLGPSCSDTLTSSTRRARCASPPSANSTSCIGRRRPTSSARTPATPGGSCPRRRALPSSSGL